ncbi:MAG: IS1096 element passenger TnpR family protein [Bacteroidota bacterium]
MKNVFKYRVVIDTTDDVFRDIEIEADNTFEELYDMILKAFDFKGRVMSSFYMSNDQWDKGHEITLSDMSESGDGKNMMKNCILNDYMEDEKQKMILVYDFMRMWIFYVELIEEFTAHAGISYPKISMKFGETPDEESKEMSDLIFEGTEGASNGSELHDENTEDEDETDPTLEDEIGDMFNDYEEEK